MGFMEHSSSSIGLFILIISFANVRQGETVCTVDSIYQFGDSCSDTGNLVRFPVVGPTLVPAARLPYGETLGKPTGRFSDGLLIIDYFAKALGIPLLNPYMDKSASFSNGVNFAVAGGTALDNFFYLAKGILIPSIGADLGVQINWFKQYLSSICKTSTECSTKLGNSLFFVGEIGGNDVRYAYAQGRSFEEIHTYIPSIVETIINNTRELIRLGAKRIVVPGNFPVGCFPAVLTTASDANATPQEFDEFGCYKPYNDLTMYQNSDLQNALTSLKQEFPDVSIVYADFYGAFLSILGNASHSGFDAGGSPLKACCGIGGKYDFDRRRGCGFAGVPVCKNPSLFMHWDGFHLTQEGYRRISEILIPDIISAIGCS